MDEGGGLKRVAQREQKDTSTTAIRYLDATKFYINSNIKLIAESENKSGRREEETKKKTTQTNDFLPCPPSEKITREPNLTSLSLSVRP